MQVFTVSESFGHQSRLKLYGRVENIYRELMFLMLVLLIGRAACEACFKQSEALPRSG